VPRHGGVKQGTGSEDETRAPMQVGKVPSLLVQIALSPHSLCAQIQQADHSGNLEHIPRSLHAPCSVVRRRAHSMRGPVSNSVRSILLAAGNIAGSDCWTTTMSTMAQQRLRRRRPGSLDGPAHVCGPRLWAQETHSFDAHAWVYAVDNEARNRPLPR
jgi:hypothetical protein